MDKLNIPRRSYGEDTQIAPDVNNISGKVDELVEAVNAGLGVSNAVVGAPKFVRYRDSRLYGVTDSDLTLEKLNAQTILPGNLATVINPADSPTQDTLPPRQYVATLVAAGTAGAVAVPAYAGASSTVLIAWQAVESAAAFTPLLATELNKEKAAYAGLELHPLLVKIVNALGGAVTTVVSQPATPEPAVVTVTGFLPDTAAVGASVTLTGSNFLKARAVTFNGTAASFQVLNATTIQAVVPAGATTGPVSVSTAASTGTSAASFTVGASTTTPTQPTTTALTAGLAIAVASIMAGNPLSYTVTASGGAGGYSYAVVATNAATGASISIGSAASGNWTPATPGDYELTATVTDAAGASKISVVRTLHVSSAPLANAGSDTVLTQPASSVTLQGSGYEQAYAGQFSYSWSQSAGPVSATFSSKTVAQPTVSGLTAVGSYTFQLIVTDAQGNVSLADEVLVTVQAAANTPSEYDLTVVGDSRSGYRGQGASAGSPDLATTTSVWYYAQKRLQDNGFTGTIRHQSYPGWSAAQFLNETGDNGAEYATAKPTGQTGYQYLLSSLPAATAKKCVVLLAFGANPTANELADIKAGAVALRRDRPDVLIIIDQVLPRLDRYYPNSIPDLATVNQGIIASKGNWSDEVVRSEASPQLSAPDAPSNSDYYWDGDFVGLSKVHLTTLGNLLQGGTNYAEAFARVMSLYLAPISQASGTGISKTYTQTSALLHYYSDTNDWSNFSYNNQYITGYGGVSQSDVASWGFTNIQCYGWRLVGPLSNLFGKIVAKENGAVVASGTQYANVDPDNATAPQVQISKYYGTTLAAHSIDMFKDSAQLGRFIQANCIQFSDINGVFPAIPAAGLAGDVAYTTATGGATLSNDTVTAASGVGDWVSGAQGTQAYDVPTTDSGYLELNCGPYNLTGNQGAVQGWTAPANLGSQVQRYMEIARAWYADASGQCIPFQDGADSGKRFPIAAGQHLKIRLYRDRTDYYVDEAVKYSTTTANAGQVTADCALNKDGASVSGARVRVVA